MKLQDYINKRLRNINEVDYVDVFVNDAFVGMHSASLALKGKYLALDSMESFKKASYCFPMDTVIEANGGSIKFNYCGSDFELTIFREAQNEN